MRDFRRLDEAETHLGNLLARRDEVREEVIEDAEDRVVEALTDTFLGHVLFSSVRRARPRGEDLLATSRYIRQRFANAPEPAVGRQR